MIPLLFNAHSGLRYLVLLAALVALVYLVYGLASGRATERGARVLTSVFVGLLDLQILLGLLLMVAGIYYPALMGHLIMMILAAVVAHAASAMARRAEPRRSLMLRLLGVVGALVLIVGGILSIGRSIFGTGVPSIVS